MTKRFVLTAVCLSLVAPVAGLAQEHWTEGPVWEVWCAQTTPGHFEDYIEYLRRNYLPTTESQEKAGLILDTKIFLHTPGSADAPDICIATMHKSFGAALDYSADFEAKGKAIAAEHYKTADEDKQEEMIAPRLDWRRDLGTQYYREITLKPM